MLKNINILIVPPYIFYSTHASAKLHARAPDLLTDRKQIKTSQIDVNGTMIVHVE